MVIGAGTWVYHWTSILFPDLIYISGEKSQPEPGELTDLTAQYFIRFEPENLQSTASKLLIIRNAT